MPSQPHLHLVPALSPSSDIEYAGSRMGAVEEPVTFDLMRAERDFYRELLQLGGHDELEPFVERALALVTEITRARRGYLELRHEAVGDDAAFRVGHAQPAEDADTLREAISHGVIAEALGSGRTVATASALLDPRFSGRGSVRRNQIEAILCVPIGGESQLGVVYLQDRPAPGPFSEADRERVESFARHLAPLAERLLLRRQHARAADPTRELRKRLRVEEVVGRSRAIADILKQVDLVAPHEVSVLITGPTGTGKSQLARVIHLNGPRAAQPFIELNCAALPETLLESELFGAVQGAHSTAHRGTEGKVGAADGGTLFLDEVADLTLTAQAKLLQLLQSGTYYPLGSSRPRQADVRVMAATNRDLWQATQNKTFREDLYYRLNVLPIRMCSLRERREDIPLLAAHCAERSARRNRLPALPLSLAATQALELEDWPGNIRELANVVEAGLLRAAADDADAVEIGHLFPGTSTVADAAAAVTFHEQMRRFKRRVLARALDDTGWNVSETARRLDLARSHVNKLILVLGLARKDDGHDTDDG